MEGNYIPRVYAVKRSEYSDKPIIAFSTLGEALEFASYWFSDKEVEIPGWQYNDCIIEIPLFGGYRKVGDEVAE